MFKKIMLLIKYGDELEALLKKEAKAKDEADRQARKHNLNLCFAHQQEQNRSHYASHNCHHCQVLLKLGEPLPEETR